MKLIHLFKYYWPDNAGGIGAGMDMAIQAFKKWSNGKPDYEQEVICCWQKSRKASAKDEYEGINVIRCKSYFEFASTQFSPQFMKTVKKRSENKDIVFYHFPYPLVDLALLFGFVHGTFVVIWHCDYDTAKGRLITALYTPLVKHALKRADAIVVGAEGTITGSPALQKYKDKCVIIPYSVSDELVKEGRKYIEEQQQNVSCTQSKSNDTQNKVHILFIGRFVWYKGIDILLRAFEKLDSNKYELTLLGRGPLLEDMKSLSNELKLKNVNFTGSVSEEEKRNWIKWSDFLVLPSVSKAESFAIVQIEAMTFGKPVINTRIPSGVPDVSIDGKTGITIEPNDEEALVSAMKTLGDDNELRVELGKNARDMVENRFSMEKLSEKYASLFDVLVR